MAYVVTQSCCADASCVLACPVNCIHPAPGEPGFAEAEMVYIDAETCVSCGACVTACPVGAIVPDRQLRPGQRPFVDLAAEYYEVFPHRDRTPLALVAPRRRLRLRRPARVAVVGAGPAGLYAADALLGHTQVSVDVLDRMERPHGLARYGVAPDHPETRDVARLFETIARRPGFRYRLGVEVGRDVTPAELERDYDAVVWATGASAARRLDVPGGRLPGVLGATALAAWSNDHPEARDLALPDRRGGRVVVVGAGNVALDSARLLIGPRVGAREVVVLGRRGVEAAAFTTPELVGLAGLAGVDVLLEGRAPDGLDVRARLLADLAGRGTQADRGARADLVRRAPSGGRPRIVLRFHAPVAEVLGGERATGVRLASGGVIEAGLVVVAIGHEWTPVPHVRGRIRPGCYVVGWAKRGPAGFIGTNRADAEETVASLLDDLEASLGADRHAGHARSTGLTARASLALPG